MSFTAKVEELDGQLFIRIPDSIAKALNLQIDDEVTLKILKKGN